MTTTARTRLPASERREQLVAVARTVFAERGYDGTSVEEVALRAGVTKPVVYEHFGGKEGLYAVVVDRDVTELLGVLRGALSDGTSRELLEQAAGALLEFIDTNADGFRILVRDAPLDARGTSFRTILGDIVPRVEGILVDAFERRGFDPLTAPMYTQMLVGMVASTGQWWLETRTPSREVVGAHLVNLAWNGLTGLQTKPGTT